MAAYTVPVECYHCDEDGYQIACWDEECQRLGRCHLTHMNACPHFGPFKKCGYCGGTGRIEVPVSREEYQRHRGEHY